MMRRDCCRLTLGFALPGLCPACELRRNIANFAAYLVVGSMKMKRAAMTHRVQLQVRTVTLLRHPVVHALTMQSLH
jgi:hypothetical protein